MAVAKLKYPKDENRLERLAERVADEINERAAKMTPEERVKADSETTKICCSSDKSEMSLPTTEERTAHAAVLCC